MYDTESVFNVLASDDTERRVASRRALALAHTRVDSRLGAFLRQAANAQDFSARFAACQEEFEGYVRTAAEEHGYEHPEYIARSLRDHYERESMVKEAPGSEHMPGVGKKRNRQYEHIKEQLLDSGKDEERAKEEAARTVNKTRRKHHELKDSGAQMMGQPPMETPGQTMQSLPPQVPPPTSPQQLQQMGQPAQMPQPLPPQDIGQPQPQGMGMGQPDPTLGQPQGQPPFLSSRRWTPFLAEKTAGPPGLPADRDTLNTNWLAERTPELRERRPPLPSVDMGGFGDELGAGLGMDQPSPHPISPEYRQQARQPGPWMVQDPAGEYPLEDPYAEQYGEPPMQDNLEAYPPRRAGFNGELDPTDPAVKHIHQQFQGVHPDEYNTEGVWMPSQLQQEDWGFGEPTPEFSSDQGHIPAGYQGPQMGYPQGDFASAGGMLPPLQITDQYAPHHGSETVTCPECGGNGKTANQGECPKCKGRGRVPNFGPSTLDKLESSVKTAEEGNTGLGSPEPKMDKRKWTPETVGDPEPDSRTNPTKRKDPLEPMKAVNDTPLDEIGEQTTERVDLPSNSGDAGWDAGGPGPAPHTKTFGDKGQVDPVTRSVLD